MTGEIQKVRSSFTTGVWWKLQLPWNCCPLAELLELHDGTHDDMMMWNTHVKKTNARADALAPLCVSYTITFIKHAQMPDAWFKLVLLLTFHASVALLSVWHLRVITTDASR